MRFYVYEIIFLILIPFLSNGCNEDSSQQSTTSPIADYTQVDFEPSWSDDGNKIVFAHANIDNDISGIYMIDPDGSNKRQIVTGFSRTPDMSPDNNWVVFSQFNQIYKIKLNNDSLVQLTYDGNNFYPKWSLDGNWLAYSNTLCNSVSQCGVWIMKSDGQEKELIEPNANFPDWHVGSSSLIFFKPAKNQDGTFNGDSLFEYIVNSNSKTLIKIINGDENKHNSYPNIYQNYIVFCSTSASGYSYIYKTDLSGTGIIRLTDTQGWSPNLNYVNQKITYTNRNPGNGRLWIMNIDGSNKIQITTNGFTDN